jgi:hypothetical protein
MMKKPIEKKKETRTAGCKKEDSFDRIYKIGVKTSEVWPQPRRFSLKFATPC